MRLVGKDPDTAGLTLTAHSRLLNGVDYGAGIRYRGRDRPARIRKPKVRITTHYP